MALKTIIVLALILLLPVNSSIEHIVQSNCRSHSNSCRTFNDYTNDADTYFTSDSSFHFMKGTHHLNVTLFIGNVTNLTFVGDESEIFLSSGCSIIWTRSSKVFLTFLSILFNETNKTMDNAALHFTNSEVKISNALFSKYHQQCIIYSRAIKQ